MIFHLAIVSRDLNESAAFYRKYGAFIGRKYETHVVIGFFGHQLVCHFAPEKIEKTTQIYPRHFGVLFEEQRDLYDFRQKAFSMDIFQDMIIRREGGVEEHHTFFLKDPSNNLIEFKWYVNERAIFGTI